MQHLHFPTPGFVVGSLAVPATAKTNNHIDCQIPPTIKGNLRPNLFKKIFLSKKTTQKKKRTRSITYNPPNVHTKLTAPSII